MAHLITHRPITRRQSTKYWDRLNNSARSERNAFVIVCKRYYRKAALILPVQRVWLSSYLIDTYTIYVYIYTRIMYGYECNSIRYASTFFERIKSVKSVKRECYSSKSVRIWTLAEYILIRTYLARKGNPIFVTKCDRFTVRLFVFRFVGKFRASNGWIVE